MKHCGSALCLAWVCVHGAFAAPAPTTPPRIPALGWQERSDWINVKTEVTPPAIGDGRADDTAAIQRALAAVRDGSVVYFPAGAYRITAPLVLRNRAGARWIGGLIIGHGRETKWVWDGAEGGTMLRLDGVAYSRFVGLALALLAPIIVGIITFHIAMAPATIGPGIVVLLMELCLARAYRAAFRPMLAARATADAG